MWFLSHEYTLIGSRFQVIAKPDSMPALSVALLACQHLQATISLVMHSAMCITFVLRVDFLPSVERLFVRSAQKT